MEGKGKIYDYRSKLDETLSSPDLTNDEMLRALVKKQFLQSPHFQFEGFTETLVERRSEEISNFLSMLRSASANDVQKSKSSEESCSGWKVKQDTEEFRVMYREGLEGTPFHTLLVESYVDGPLDVCLCVSWESGLYSQWWPQTAIPTFKLISSQCLKRVRDGEQISLVRMKVSWPLSNREALIHYFAFEYFQDGLMVVLFNSIPDSETIDRSTHGFTRDGIPDAEDVIRIDVVGGFALQKVTESRSYFRTIANIDIKMDFIPPSFINFIARQLVGGGFKLFKKQVASVYKGDDKFLEALKAPLYDHVRKAVLSMGSPDLEEADRNPSTILEEKNREAFEDNSGEQNNRCDDSAINSEVKDAMVGDGRELNEIEELAEKDNSLLESSNTATYQIAKKLGTDKEGNFISSGGEQAPRTTNLIVGSEINKKVTVRPEVGRALETLEKAISVLQEYKVNHGKGQSDISKGNQEEDDVEELNYPQADQIGRKKRIYAEPSKVGSAEMSSRQRSNTSDNHVSRYKGDNTCTKETNQSKITPASPDEDRSSSSCNSEDIVASQSCTNGEMCSTVDGRMIENHRLSADANSTHGKKKNKKKNKKSRSCWLQFVSG